MKNEHNNDFEKMLLLRQTGELPKNDENRLDMALIQSPELASTEQDFKTVLSLYHASRPDIPLSSETIASLVRAAEASKRPPSRPLAFPVPWLRVAIAACAAVAIGWGVLLVSSSKDPLPLLSQTDTSALERARIEVAFAAEVLLQSGDEPYWDETAFDMADFVLLALPGEG